MIPEFFPSSDPDIHLGLWKTVIGLFIVFIGTCVGVEIRIDKDDEEK